MDQIHSSKKYGTLMEFAFWLEILALCLEAGMGLTQAIQEILNSFPKSHLSPLFHSYLNQLKFGKSKEDALLDLEKKLPQPWGSSLSHSILASDRYGIPLTKIFRNHAQTLRTQSFSLLERQNQLTQFKLLFPLFLLILPAVILILMTPLFIQLFKSS